MTVIINNTKTSFMQSIYFMIERPTVEHPSKGAITKL